MIEKNIPQNWKDYALLDCGNGEKLEQFGNFTIIRPEPQAIWDKKWSSEVWNKRADARFVRDITKINNRDTNSINGGWQFVKKLPESWQISYTNPEFNIQFKLQWTSFGHIGVFPEQATNWDFIYSQIKLLKNKQPKVLNLFAYTGGASVVARAAGAEVTHVDAVKSVVNWGKENLTLSNLNDIRWIVDDAKKFVQREVKRGNIYDCIILDPPAYGRGPDGEKWILEDQINELVADCSKILQPNQGFVVLNLYAMGFSSLIAQNLLQQHFPKHNTTCGELVLLSESGIALPLSVYARGVRNEES